MFQGRSVLMQDDHDQHNDDTPRNRNNETRIQSFRALNRNRPLKQLRSIMVVFGCMCFYGYLLLGSSGPNYNFEEVSRFNQKQQVQFLKHQEERRVEMAEKRKQRLEANRERARKKALWKEQQKNQTASIATNTTTLEEGEIRSKNDALFRFVNFASSLLVFFAVISMVRVVLRACIFARLGHVPRQVPRRTTSAERARTARQQRFRNWVRNLNQQRQRQGERPLSMESLRLVLRERDLTGNDYDALLNFGDESGPAMEALLRSMGATREEINRCPQRVLQEGDDLLQPHRTTGVMPQCPVCLELYAPEQTVRTIPCFHTFHTECIDPWLSQKAVCPVCKHPAVA